MPAAALRDLGVSGWQTLLQQNRTRARDLQQYQMGSQLYTLIDLRVNEKKET